MLSMFIHAAVVIILLIKDDAQQPQKETVEIAYIADPTPAPPAPSEASDAPKKKVNPSEIEPVRNKVVEQDKQINNEEIDKKTELLSKFNQHVEQEPRPR